MGRIYGILLHFLMSTKVVKWLMQLVILVCAQNVVRSLFVKTLYIAPPALLPSEAEADT